MSSKPRNYSISSNGVMRFSSSRSFKKTGSFKFVGKKTKAAQKDVQATTLKKTIGGEKNGGSRVVKRVRAPKSFETQVAPHKLQTRKNAFSQHKRRLRSSITPGTVLILLAGRHKGKRVVFLKQLQSGLLLITGPFTANGCPLRRVNQIYVIATSTKVDISQVPLPERINDDYFRRTDLKKPAAGANADAQIFEAKKEKYAVSEERKADQVAVDKALIKVVKGQKEGNIVLKYLRCMFSLDNHQYPHNMKF